MTNDELKQVIAALEEVTLDLISQGGPSVLIDRMKCEGCGWSVTAGARASAGA
jgi:hypothetical protein